MCLWLCLFGVVGSFVPGVRDKIRMAWRHRSGREKVQLGSICFLCFALFCFIIAVVAMDLTFKARIRDLEDELAAYKTTSPETSLSTSDFTKDSSSTTTAATDITTTEPTTTKPTTTTTTTTTSTGTSTSSITTSMTTGSDTSTGLL